ncbi:MAG: translation elongation factor-like protein [Candidatus Aenigmarchaeota archaeon]|nr:translation elongation factor-like protein [Candidatus Aenigmarchaeota archaeon]
MAEKPIGKVTHFFTHLDVAVIELSDTLKAGDKIHIKGATTDIEQLADSMQVDHKPVEEGKKGESVGMKVKDRVREGDEVFKVEA